MVPPIRLLCSSALFLLAAGASCLAPDLHTPSDSDGDGWLIDQDCDDSDPTVYPLAVDSYGDGIDQDCDSCLEVSGDGIDRDCDGYPANDDVEATVRDCDDEDPDIHPDAVEECDDVDNDCNGEVDDAWACGPGDCGDGPWGNLDSGCDAVFVSADADSGGDGSQEQPFQSIQEGLDAAVERRAADVVVAAGTYLEALSIGVEHTGLRLAGRCAELVVLDSSLAGSSTAGIEVLTGEAGVSLSGFTVQGSPYMGVLVGAGTAELSHVVVRESGSGIGAYADDPSAPPSVLVEHSEMIDNATVGVFAQDVGTLVELRESSVESTSGSDLGFGVYITTGAQLLAEDSRVQGSEGPAIVVTSDAVLEASGLELLDNEFAAVAIEGAWANLEEVLIRGVEEHVNLGGGCGVYARAEDGSSGLQMQGGSVDATLVAAIWLSGGGSYVLEDSDLAGGTGDPFGSSVRCADGVFATQINDAEDLVLRDNSIHGAVGAGLFLDSATATREGNTWNDNELDLVSQGQGCEGSYDGDDELGSSEICPEWDSPTCELYFSLRLELAEVDED